MFWLRICVKLVPLEAVIGVRDGKMWHVGIPVVEVVGMVVLDRVVVAI